MAERRDLPGMPSTTLVKKVTSILREFLGCRVPGKDAHSVARRERRVVNAITKAPSKYVGQFARSIESGWLGKVIAVETHDGDTMLRMQGVNELCLIVAGGKASDWLDEDDIQWFAPDDVEIVSPK